YLTFNSHIATAEKGLIDAINQLKLANNGTGISDLVLDLRYNGGGYLALAAELGFMIAGEANTQGKIFEQTSFNDKNPFGLTAAETQTPFYKTAVGFSVAKGTPLPQLGLKRVFILSGHNTCSASEAIINGLRGAGIEVVLIGDTTCGKPYGFYAQDNCSTTYFAIQFKGVNNQGFGDYADGFIPGGTGSTADNVPGCNVVDDLSQQLGDPAEARLAAALQYRATGKCTSSASSLARSVANRGLLYGANGLLAPSPLSAMRLLGKPGQR
uniref:S41 family peptidase n=1 Tax=Chitinimonas sp. TaxID=1934313 RepID=UPI0035AF5D7C